MTAKEIFIGADFIYSVPESSGFDFVSSKEESSKSFGMYDFREFSTTLVLYMISSRILYNSQSTI